MAMTVERLIMNAVARVGSAQQDTVIKDPAEIIDQVNLIVKRWFTFVVQEHRLYFAVFVTVPMNDGKWTKPLDAESVLGVYGNGTTVPAMASLPVDVVPFDDFEASERAIRMLGKYYYVIPGSNHPQSGSLDFLYARRPILLDVAGALTQGIDPDWPDGQTDVLEVDLAIWVAGRHGLTADVERLTQRLTVAEAHLRAHLTHLDASLVTSKNSPRPSIGPGQATA